MNNFLPTDYQNFIHKSRYARWLPDEQRREEWPETVGRYFNYMEDWLELNHNYYVTPKEREELETAVLNLEIMPSMRAMMTAGKALERNHVAAYNCSYIPIDHPRAFDELLYILMCGTGVGFSVERNNVDMLPRVADTMDDIDETIYVEDSKEGWADSYRQLLALLWVGKVPSYNVDAVRPSGSRLETFGGRASGAQPLLDLFEFTINVFNNARGRQLYPIECHDIACKIGQVVVVGGVRRSALISLSNLNDDQMRHAKSGEWWDDPQNGIIRHGHRALANNSATYKHRPEMETFMREWLSLVESKSGERGMFNRQAAQLKAAENGRRDADHQFGTNPCSEIILRPYQFCNLTEVVVRPHDDEASLLRKVALATKLGTWQSTLTKFKYLRDVWSENTKEERLLGVSLTGIMDSPLLSGRDVHYGKNIAPLLEHLRGCAVETNRVAAFELAIQPSTAITCIKPSGTVSQLVDSASGIHARHSKFYKRTVRAGNDDPITAFMKDVGIPAEPCEGQPDKTTVFTFPIAAPSGIDRNAMTAIEQLEMWMLYAKHWCEHKPSVTISVREHEWLEVGAWVYKHFDYCSGVSFLPHSDHVYAQAPYQDSNEVEIQELRRQMPDRIDWSQLAAYETEDNTTGSQELSCTAGVCEVVDIAS